MLSCRMTIYYVRHGESTGNVLQGFFGLVDSTLTANGVKQALALGNQIRDIHIDIVFSSPQIRARQTAEIAMSARPHAKRPLIITDSRLVEHDNGEIEGMLFESERVAKVRDFYGERKLFDYSTAESFQSIEKRIKSFFDEIKETYHGKTILVFAHGGIGRIAHAYFHGMPKSGLYCDSPDMKNCELIKFD